MNCVNNKADKQEEEICINNNKDRLLMFFIRILCNKVTKITVGLAMVVSVLVDAEAE